MVCLPCCGISLRPHHFLDDNTPDETPDITNVAGDVADAADAVDTTDATDTADTTDAADAPDDTDAADVADADAFEELMYTNGLSTATFPDQQDINEAPDEQHINLEIEAANADAASTVIID